MQNKHVCSQLSNLTDNCSLWRCCGGNSLPLPAHTKHTQLFCTQKGHNVLSHSFNNLHLLFVQWLRTADRSHHSSPHLYLKQSAFFQCFLLMRARQKINQTESRFTYNVLLWKSLQMSVQSVWSFHVVCNRLMTLLATLAILITSAGLLCFIQLRKGPFWIYFNRKKSPLTLVLCWKSFT